MLDRAIGPEIGLELARHWNKIITRAVEHVHASKQMF